MRHVIYVLLVVNGVYFAWNMLRSLPHEEGWNLARQMPANLRRLETIQDGVAKSANASARAPVGGAPVSGGPQGGAPEPVVEPKTAEIRRVEALTASQPPGALAPVAKCHVLGPFRDDKEMKTVEKRLNQLGYEPKERTGETRVETGYRIYLPAMEREEALRIKRMLDKKNDRDYLIVKRNAVSLGAYDSRARADLRLQMLRKYGLDPVVEPRYTSRTGHWLDLDLPDDGRAVLEKIQDEYPSAQVQEAACP